MIKLVINLRFQARLTCSRACTLSYSQLACVSLPLTTGKHSPLTSIIEHRTHTEARARSLARELESAGNSGGEAKADRGGT